MAFMSPVAEHLTMYRVETNVGTELVPEEVCGAIDLQSPPDGDTWRAILDYVEGSRIEGVEREEGWYGRLSAPGYLDCTDWDGPYPTAEEALDAVKETYDVDDNGDDAGEDWDTNFDDTGAREEES